MPEAPHPVDVHSDELVATYLRAGKRLESLVSDALRRGLNPSLAGEQPGAATAAYRVRQLDQARAILRELEANAGRLAPVAVQRSYLAGLRAVDVTNSLGGTQFAAEFGRVHQRQVLALTANLDGPLRAAAARAGENLELVFARATEVAGALEPGGNLGGLGFIGRRQDDPYRRIALEVLGEGTVALDTRRQVSAQLARRLVTEGVADALTGYVDRAGRRWPLPVYAEMVARTTTREAASRATVERLRETGLDLVTVSSHPHKADECTPYDGRTFSIDGSDRYRRLERMPPFHPRCRHVLTPASVNLDDFERELGLENPAAPGAGASPAMPAEPPHAPIDNLAPPTTPPRSILGGQAGPVYDNNTRELLEAQRIRRLIDGDPGPDPGRLTALLEEENAAATAARTKLPYAELTAGEKRARTAALKLELGDSHVKFLRGSYARKLELEDRFVRGDVTLDELEHHIEDAWLEQRERDDRRQEKERASQYRRRSIPCFSCGRFKRRPADVCDYCGDSHVTGVNFAGGLSDSGDYNARVQQINREYGYDE